MVGGVAIIIVAVLLILRKRQVGEESPDRSGYVCIYVCMNACMYVCNYVCIIVYMYMYVCMYVYMYVCIYCMYICMYVCAYNYIIYTKYCNVL